MKFFGKKKGDAKEGGLGKGISNEANPFSSASSDDVAGLSEDAMQKINPFSSDKTASSEKEVDSDTARSIREEVMSGVKEKGGWGKNKEPKVKKPKKSNKKGELTEEEQIELQGRLSDRVEIEHMIGMQKEDAIQTALHWARDHARNPSNCYYNVVAVNDGSDSGYLIEVQEGVGRTYLPSAMKLAQDNPNRIVVIPMFRRKMTFFYSPKTGEYDAQILGEGVEPPVINNQAPLIAQRGAAMTPVMKQHMQWLITGSITAGIGAVALLSSLAFYAFDPETRVPPEWRTTNVTQLPVMQWPRLQSDDSGSYVVRLEFADNAWRVVRQDVSARVDTVEVPDTGTEIEGAAGPIEAPADDPNSAPVAPPAVPPQVPNSAPAAPPAAPPALPPGVPPTIPTQGQ